MISVLIISTNLLFFFVQNSICFDLFWIVRYLIHYIIDLERLPLLMHLIDYLANHQMNLKSKPMERTIAYYV